MFYETTHLYETKRGSLTLHFSMMKEAKQTSRSLLGTSTICCFKASGTEKLSDWLAGWVELPVEGVTSEALGSETWTLTGSLRHTSDSRARSAKHQTLCERDSTLCV